MVQIKRRRSTAIVRELFDDVIDCLYEYDLGEILPDHWPAHVRRTIEASRKRIMRRDTPRQTTTPEVLSMANCKHSAAYMKDGRPRCALCDLEAAEYALRRIKNSRDAFESQRIAFEALNGSTRGDVKQLCPHGYKRK